MRQLVEQRSSLADVDYKHCEDLIDAVICAYPALWYRHGVARCQVLGPTAAAAGPVATIIAPAKRRREASIVLDQHHTNTSSSDRSTANEYASNR